MSVLGAKVRGYLFVGTGLLACPCHLPITIPLLLALTAGTAVSSFLVKNVWLIAGVSTLYFIAALVFGLRYLGQEETACEVKPPVEYCAPTGSEMKEEV